MNEPYDILIVGGGVVGLSAALALSQYDYRIAVFDAGELNLASDVSSHRVYAINQQSQAFLEQLKVWPLVDKQASAAYQRMHIWDAANQATIDFDARMIAQPYLGTIVEESALKTALLKVLSQQVNVTCVAETAIDAVDQSAASISIKQSDSDWTGKLLIVADGPNSPLRQLLSVPMKTWSYHQHAIVAKVQVEKAHQKTAYQVFNPDGPLAFLPLNDDHQCSIVWSTSSAHAKQLMAMDEQRFAHELTQAFAGCLGQVTLLNQRVQFPLTMRHATNYVGKNWLLMGDAAHTIHPLAGLGLNVGLADIQSLLVCLENTQHPFPAKKSLLSYQRERKNDVWQLIWVLQGLKQLFANQFSPIVALRKLGLNVCNQSNLLKKLFINYASK